MKGEYFSLRSTKSQSKHRRDLINQEINNLRELLPFPPTTRHRLSQLQLMACSCVLLRKNRYFAQGQSQCYVYQCWNFIDFFPFFQWQISIPFYIRNNHFQPISARFVVCVKRHICRFTMSEFVFASRYPPKTHLTIILGFEITNLGMQSRWKILLSWRKYYWNHGSKSGECIIISHVALVVYIFILF